MSGWAILRTFRICDPVTGELYLWRLRLVETPWFGIYLHRFHAPDHDRAEHDHPFAFLSVVLSGSYVEEVTDDAGATRSRRVRWFNWKPLPGRHRIALIAPRLLTLVFRGPRRREWGFYTDAGWVDWRTFLGEEGS